MSILRNIFLYRDYLCTIVILLKMRYVGNIIETPSIAIEEKRDT